MTLGLPPLEKVVDPVAAPPLIVNVTVAPFVPQPAAWLAELTFRLKLVVDEIQVLVVVVLPQSVPPTYARTTEPDGAATPFTFASPGTVICDSVVPLVAVGVGVGVRVAVAVAVAVAVGVPPAAR